ncbi:MAG: ArnT family glycosyltransferase [Limnohabitans sp.]
MPGLGRLRPHVIFWTALALLVNAVPLLTPILNEGDSVLYAALSQHMVLSGNWNDLILDGRDWLDKPHFPFWLGALSFQLLGVSVFAYMLPGFLFHLLGGYYTYRIARLFDDRDTALVALLVYVSVYHLMYTTTALKAEAFLTGSIMAACYHWWRFDTHARMKHLVLGAIFSGMAVMTKGVFTLITIGSGLLCMWAYQGRWRELFRLKWWLALCLTAVCVTPELLALYRQFDAYPEKTVFNQTGVSGIRFFLWDSQFGRFFNTGPITNQAGNKWFFVAVFVWAFLPWVAAFGAGCWQAVRAWSTWQTARRSKWVFLAASFGVSFVMFSLTRFQLDYYTVIVYPFAALMCAPWLVSACLQTSRRGVRWVQAGMGLFTLVLAVWVAWQVGHVRTGVVFLTAFLCWLAYAVWQRQQHHGLTVLVHPVAAVLSLYAVLEAMTLVAHTRYSIPYNVLPWLASEPALPVVVYRLDPPVAYELGVYRQTAPVQRVNQADALPTDRSYFFIAKTSDLNDVRALDVRAQLLVQAQWVDHKTGTLPRQIALAAGRAPTESFSVYKVQPR